MRFELAVDALEAWKRDSGFVSVTRAETLEAGVCLRAKSGGSARVAVIRPRSADRREYGRLISFVDRAHLQHDLVYAATTRKGLRYARHALMVRGAGIVRVTPDGSVVVELEPRRV